MSWISTEGAIQRGTLERVAKLTNDATRFAKIGVGNGSAVRFLLETVKSSSPFAKIAGDPVDGTDFALSLGTGAGGLDELVFDSAPNAGEQIDARLGEAVNVAKLKTSIDESASKVAAVCRKEGFVPPAASADPSSIPSTLVSWTWALAMWDLATKNPPMLGAFPDIEKVYVATKAEMDKASRYLEGVLPLAEAADPDEPSTDPEMVSEERVFGGENGLS